MTTSRIDNTPWIPKSSLVGTELLAVDDNTAVPATVTPNVLAVYIRQVIESGAYSYLVFFDTTDSLYKAVDSKGIVGLTNAAATTVLQYALTNGGGTAASRNIIFSGEFTTTATLAMESYTNLVIDGSITAGTITTAVVRNVGFAGGGNVQCHVIGGSIYGGNLTNGKACIDFQFVDGYSVTGCRIDGSIRHGIHAENSDNGIITNNHISNCEDDCVTMLKGSNLIVSNNILDVGPGISGGSHGVEIEDDAHYVTISGNVISSIFSVTDKFIGGILVAAETTASQAICSHITITGNTIKDCPSNGINIDGQVDSDKHDYVTITGNIVENSGFAGIRVKDTNGLVVGNNIVVNGISQGQAMLFTNCDNASITNNFIENMQRNGIQLTTSANCDVSGNKIKDMGQEDNPAYRDGIVLTGTGTFWPFNVTIANNSFADPSGIGNMRGVRFTNADFATITGNMFDSSLTDAITRDSGSNSMSVETVISGNRGYLTENGGLATLTGVTEVVSHGLERTPLDGQVIITPQNAGAGANAWRVTQINSADFTITGSTGSDFGWNIEAAGSRAS